MSRAADIVMAGRREPSSGMATIRRPAIAGTRQP
jgi:hypothetical protein